MYFLKVAWPVGLVAVKFHMSQFRNVLKHFIKFYPHQHVDIKYNYRFQIQPFAIAVVLQNFQGPSAKMMGHDKKN
jgi:hypothetical protein